MKAFSYNGRLIIVDASKDPLRSDDLPSFVDYHHMIKVSFVDSFRKTHSSIQTKYISLVGDDDFPCLSGLAECLNRLENDNQLRTCSGQTMWINYQRVIDKSSPNSLANFLRWIMLHKIDQKSKDNKLGWVNIVNEMVQNYQVKQFQIMKVGLWKKVFNQEFALIKDKSMGEIASSLMIAINAPHAVIDNIYLLRGTGYMRPSTDPKDAIHDFPELDYAREELVNYYLSQGLKDELIMRTLLACSFSIRMQEYIPKKRKAWLDQNSEDIVDRVRHIFGCEGLLSNLSYLADHSPK